MDDMGQGNKGRQGPEQGPKRPTESPHTTESPHMKGQPHGIARRRCA